MRGLKLLKYHLKTHCQFVASFTDAWIETQVASDWLPSPGVASFTDAWIETGTGGGALLNAGSHLLQMRGLKQEESQSYGT